MLRRTQPVGPVEQTHLPREPVFLTREGLSGQKRPLPASVQTVAVAPKKGRLQLDLPDGITKLEASSVTESTQRTYLRYVQELLLAMGWQTLNVSEMQLLDRAMVLLCSTWAEEGQKPAKGHKLLAG
eukprot:6475433-Amphidinium_carterae.1